MNQLSFFAYALSACSFSLVSRSRSLSPNFSYLTNNKLKNYPKKATLLALFPRGDLFFFFLLSLLSRGFFFSCWALEKVGITLACFSRLDALFLSTCVISVGLIPVLAEELSVLALSATKSRSRTDLNVSLCSLLSFQASNKG